MLHEKQRLAKQEGMTVAEVDTYMRRWRNAAREAKALHKFTEVGGRAWGGWVVVGVVLWFGDLVVGVCVGPSGWVGDYQSTDTHKLTNHATPPAAKNRWPGSS